MSAEELRSRALRYRLLALWADNELAALSLRDVARSLEAQALALAGESPRPLETASDGIGR
jgi:hypothetical protein